LKHSIIKNLKLVESALGSVSQSLQNAADYKQKTLGKKDTGTHQKKLETLENEIRQMTNFKKTLEDIKNSFLDKKKILKEFVVHSNTIVYKGENPPENGNCRERERET